MSLIDAWGWEQLCPTENLKEYKEVNTYIKQTPYVGEDGIYVPCEEYVRKGCSSAYKCVLTKEMFVEAYNKWIKE